MVSGICIDAQAIGHGQNGFGLLNAIIIGSCVIGICVPAARQKSAANGIIVNIENGVTGGGGGGAGGVIQALAICHHGKDIGPQDDIDPQDVVGQAIGPKAMGLQDIGPQDIGSAGLALTARVEEEFLESALSCHSAAAARAASVPWNIASVTPRQKRICRLKSITAGSLQIKTA